MGGGIGRGGIGRGGIGRGGIGRGGIGRGGIGRDDCRYLFAGAADSVVMLRHSHSQR